MVCCDECGADMVEKTTGRGYVVLACRRGCTSYRTMDLETGLLLPAKTGGAQAAKDLSKKVEATCTA